MVTALTVPDIDMAVFRRYAGLSLPRHVSYPMPTGWNDLQGGDFAEMLQTSQERFPNRHWSFYLHIPFCSALCRYCACHRQIIPKKNRDWQEPTQAYVDSMITELLHLQGAVHPRRELKQVHWGGGSPAYLSLNMIEQLSVSIRDRFNLAGDAEISIELDPRNISIELLRLLKQLGFNRLSLGVQDFDPKVQEHVRRIQPYDMVREKVDQARELGFDSINFDLIYGMPYQTVESIAKTVARTIQLQPDRVAYYHYAQIPHKIATQRGMDYTVLPDSETKLQMFLVGLQLFSEAGYDFIGLDHFARSEEMLARAANEGTLQRNFQGMTTGGGLDLVGVGASSISHFLEIGFTQNVKELDQYQEIVSRSEWSTVRGKWFTPDDIIRQAVINQIFCQAEIRPLHIERRFGIGFDEYFTREMQALRVLEQDGVVQLEPDGRIRVTFPLGRVLMRNISAVFDAYLGPGAYCMGDRDYFSANA